MRVRGERSMRSRIPQVVGVKVDQLRGKKCPTSPLAEASLSSSAPRWKGIHVEPVVTADCVRVGGAGASGRRLVPWRVASGGSDVGGLDSRGMVPTPVSMRHP